jgi:hypothetical protein
MARDVESVPRWPALPLAGVGALLMYLALVVLSAGAGRLALMVAGAAYWLQAGLLVFHRYSRADVSPLSRLLRWLFRPIVWFPAWPMWWLSHTWYRRRVMADLGDALQPGEAIVDLTEQRADAFFTIGGVWAWSDRALYMGSVEGVYWRVEFKDLEQVSEVVLPPGRRTEVILTVTGQRTNPSGVFSTSDAKRLSRIISRESAVARQSG